MRLFAPVVAAGRNGNQAPSRAGGCVVATGCTREEAVAEGVHRPDGAFEWGLVPSCQLHPEIRSITAGSWAMTVTGASWLAPYGDDRGGLVVAEDDEDEVIVGVGLHEGAEGVQRVLD